MVLDKVGEFAFLQVQEVLFLLLLHDKFLDLIVLRDSLLHFALSIFNLWNVLGVKLPLVIFELSVQFCLIHGLDFEPLLQLNVFVLQLDQIVTPVKLPLAVVTCPIVDALRVGAYPVSEDVVSFFKIAVDFVESINQCSEFVVFLFDLFLVLHEIGRDGFHIAFLCLPHAGNEFAVFDLSFIISSAIFALSFSSAFALLWSH